MVWQHFAFVFSFLNADLHLHSAPTLDVKKAHLSFNFSFFGAPFLSRHIALLVQQLHPKRQQASLFDNRSNQLPSLPPLCVPLFTPLYFPAESEGENHFSKQQHREGKWIRKQRQKGIKTQPIEQVPSLWRGLRHIWQLSTACRCLPPLAETGKSCSCSITLDTGSLNREIGTSRRAARDTQICNKEPDSDHCFDFEKIIIPVLIYIHTENVFVWRIQAVSEIFTSLVI